MVRERSPVQSRPCAPKQRTHLLKIEIRLKSFERSLLRRSVAQLQGFAHEHTLSHDSSLGLPARKTYTTILRSPHVHKKARDQYILCTHKALLRFSAPPQRLTQFCTALQTLRLIGVQLHLRVIHESYYTCQSRESLCPS